MEQERYLFKLQELVQQEQQLKGKHVLKPLISTLRKLQDSIKETEAWCDDLQRQAEEVEKKAQELEKNMAEINKKKEAGKEKLYSAKGGSLKELLSLQQSVLKMEEEIEKGEALYWELAKQTEELKNERQSIREKVRNLKKEYNENVKTYKEQVGQLEIKLAENKAIQEEIRGLLQPELLRLFTDVEKRIPGTPVALLKGEICSGCRISIPSVLALRIREGKTLSRCENCGRILIKEDAAF